MLYEKKFDNLFHIALCLEFQIPPSLCFEISNAILEKNSSAKKCYVFKKDTIIRHPLNHSFIWKGNLCIAFIP